MLQAWTQREILTTLKHSHVQPAGLLCKAIALLTKFLDGGYALPRGQGTHHPRKSKQVSAQIDPMEFLENTLAPHVVSRCLLYTKNHPKNRLINAQLWGRSQLQHFSHFIFRGEARPTLQLNLLLFLLPELYHLQESNLEGKRYYQ